MADRSSKSGTRVAMAYSIAHGQRYTDDSGRSWTPQEAMLANGFDGDDIAEVEQVARERFGWR